MALPSSGQISLSQVNTELSLTSTAAISLNDSAVRGLFGKASGTISMSDGWGKSSALYAFTSFTFTNAGATGVNGPTLSNCLSSYSTATYPWLNNTAYFNVITQGYQLWTVPASGNYRITAVGAAGGSGNTGAGAGTKMVGTFALTAGQKLKIAVGQMGSAGNNGCSGLSGAGGGGTFVVSEDNIIAYIIAGGGGGGAPGGSGGNHALITTNGGSGYDSNANGGTVKVVKELKE